MTVVEPPGGTMYDVVFPGRRRLAEFFFGGGFGALPKLESIRFRDGWFELGEPTLMCMYCRIGGPNRAAYAARVAPLLDLDIFVSYEDDWFDPTYAALRFMVPPELAAKLAAIAPVFQALGLAYRGRVDTGRRWEEALERVQRGEVTDEERAAQEALVEVLREAMGR